MEGGIIKRWIIVFVMVGLMFVMATEVRGVDSKEEIFAFIINPCTLPACIKECKETVRQTFLKAYCKSENVCLCYGLAFVMATESASVYYNEEAVKIHAFRALNRHVLNNAGIIFS
ncbi:hypothetical protein TorRG33x02_124580 [Trema orientale]|uniref:Uncharacterized protein n=1 Tax=Trema orientale TaxID=63057 RepID=A0A2P5F239_TREOI|nr:hypothetical protein TorRG33x02_124580 [Trema orientale]